MSSLSLSLLSLSLSLLSLLLLRLNIMLRLPYYYHQYKHSRDSINENLLNILLVLLECDSSHYSQCSSIKIKTTISYYDNNNDNIG